MSEPTIEEELEALKDPLVKENERLRDLLHYTQVDLLNVCVKLSHQKETDNGPEHLELCRISRRILEALTPPNEAGR